MFDGRIAEDFKLLTGTWVSVGPLKTRIVLHFAPYVRDLVMTGADRDEIGALFFADGAACRAALSQPADERTGNRGPAPSGGTLAVRRLANRTGERGHRQRHPNHARA